MNTILVIDDTPDHLELISRVLGAYGYQVLAAQDDTSGLHAATSQRPDLVLLALTHPGAPGWERQRQLSAQPEFGGAPVLGTTVYSTLVSQARAESIGCAGYLEKPFSIDSLLDRVQRLLRPALAA